MIYFLTSRFRKNVGSSDRSGPDRQNKCAESHQINVFRTVGLLEERLIGPRGSIGLASLIC